ncbi:oxygen-independent coproporphyrinogen III oxidase [Sulfitobacter sp. S190]|uniref:oxygen-independent coproporphyrinogen III oxidase n=1 Tax=Sulfitobacter sp. S190 TaxID=2867022 RepID=UPI0021A4D529|nr:oxygen-independent coproporphyrinogen III oxidase [Sulfitobacter sp. S190]UWR22637.1 oxygen-independent coproporphyrinogen III oxidase [Sulfitobacter sp. S190]
MEQIDHLRRYGLFDAKVPRYTSYPPANHFLPGVGAARQEKWLHAVPNSDEISVYVHIPFCKRLCWFCACRTQGTQTSAPIDAYIETLLAEIRRVRSRLAPGIRMRRLHLGGGTPTILTAHTMDRLLAALFDAFAQSDRFEFSVEVDPTEADPDTLDILASYGLQRASVGVQDFEAAVQEAIGRRQSPAQTRDVIDRLRGDGVRSLNIDLLYGLPRQTEATFRATLDRVRDLQPDRLAIYGYAHVPWMSKRQVMIKDEDLPSPDARFILSEIARDHFETAGYLPVGIDHFARSTDSLARAAQAGTLRRNFQGYTDDDSPTLIGLGASAISYFREGYSQNAPATSAYQSLIHAGGLAGRKGYTMSAHDTLVSDIISDLMCRFVFDKEKLLRTHPDMADTIAETARGLLTFLPDGFATSPERLHLRPPFHPLARIIASRIDLCASPQTEAHSAAI